MMATLKRLRRDTGGVALMEFAFIFPVVIVLAMTGSELTNYIITRMRISQIALHIADNAARMGKGSLLSAKTISEADINDVFIGAQMQSGEIDVKKNGRIILSDLEPVANPNPTNKYKIVWQRCYGDKTTRASTYGTAGQTDLDGIGPTNQKVTATDDNATMFVEVYYVYRPLIGLGTLSPSTTMAEIASMSVRDRRDLSRIYNSEGATVSSC
jgi:Flp pilus assembly pilin Flp